MSDTVRQIPQWWHLIRVDCCVVCGSRTKKKQRMYGRPPRSRRERYTYVQVYDGCRENDNPSVNSRTQQGAI